MTAIPCGQKKSNRAISHSQTVTPPLAAIDGMTFRLNTATTNSNAKSTRPRTRFRCGWLGSEVIGSSGDWVIVPSNSIGLGSFDHPMIRWPDGTKTRSVLVRCDSSYPLVLCRGQRIGNVRECCEVLVDVGFRVLHRNRPLLIPPIRLRHHSAIDHRKPVMAPQVDVDRQPVAIVFDLCRIQHQRAIHAGARDVSLQTGFGDYPA